MYPEISLLNLVQPQMEMRGKSQPYTDWQARVGEDGYHMAGTFHYDEAMKECSRMMRGIVDTLPKPDGTNSTETMQVPNGGLADMIGQVKIPANGATFFATIDPTDLTKIVLRSDAQQKLETEAYAQKKKEALKKAEKTFKDGKKLMGGATMHPNFKGLIAYRSDSGEWTLGKNKETWASLRTVDFDLLKKPNFDVLKRPFNAQDLPYRMKNKSNDELVPVVFDEEIRLLVANKLRSFNKDFGMPSINRGGNGAKVALTGKEDKVYEMLRHLALHFPDALHPNPKVAFGFTTRCIALRHRLREQLLGTDDSTGVWGRWGCGGWGGTHSLKISYTCLQQYHM